jgi:hypothetical protein
MMFLPPGKRSRARRTVSTVLDDRRLDADAFHRLPSPRWIDRLEADGGLSIVSTHLGRGFTKAGCLKPATEARRRHLTAKAGCFVLVADLLDRLLAAGESRGEALRLEAAPGGTHQATPSRRLIKVGTVEPVTSSRRS